MQLAQEGINLSLPVELVVVISAPIREHLTVFEHVVDGNEHGMRHSDNGALLATADAETLILGMKEGRLDHDGRMSTLDESGFEHLVSLGGSAGKTLSGAFVVSGSDTSP